MHPLKANNVDNPPLTWLPKIKHPLIHMFLQFPLLLSYPYWYETPRNFLRGEFVTATQGSRNHIWYFIYKQRTTT